MRTSKEIVEGFEKPRREQTGLGSFGQSLQMQVYLLEVLLDVRELLIEIRDQHEGAVTE